jgi:hypothetical protein
MRKKTAKYWVFVLTFPIFFTLMLCVTRLIITAAKEWTPIIIYDLWTHNPYVVILLYTMMYLVLLAWNTAIKRG